VKAFAFEESWEVIRQMLPAHLEALARQSGSFQRARLLEQGPQRAAQVRWPAGYRFRLIDATTVKEPGPKGRTWRVHYSLRLPELDCDHFELTALKAGESFKRWQAAPNEVLLALRAVKRSPGGPR
jgi:hypothetical protein